MSTERCLIGKLLDTQCGTHRFTKDETDAKDLSHEDLKNLEYRVPNFPDKPTGVICSLHRNNMLINYSLFQNKYCDPLIKHSAPIKYCLRDVTLVNCEHFYEASYILIAPGNKLCFNCLESIRKRIENFETRENPIAVEGNPSTIIEKNHSVGSGITGSS